MHIVIVSCYAYRDCWKPFFALLQKFWPDRKYPTRLVTDGIEDSDYRYLPKDITVHVGQRGKALWCQTLANGIKDITEPVMVLQEDFLLNAPVRQHLIDRALEQLKERKAGSVRLYPCPGGIEEYGDPHFAIVPKGTQYRISCQATIFDPKFLYDIAIGFHAPHDFELLGTPLADSMPQEVLAFKRDVEPWPLEYLCTAIARGKWDPDAKRLCDLHGIENDWSRRPFLVAPN